MTLCQKCADAINKIGLSSLPVQAVCSVVPESECEFWAHKKIRELTDLIEKMNREDLERRIMS